MALNIPLLRPGEAGAISPYLSPMLQTLMAQRFKPQELDLSRQELDERRKFHEAELAQRQQATQRALMPHASGDVANALYVESLRNQFGEDDPSYLAAKQAHDSTLKSRESLMQYRQQLGEYAPFRALSPLGKEIAEGQGIGALDFARQKHTAQSADVPVSVHPDVAPHVASEPYGVPKSPIDPQKADAYQRAIAKRTSDTDARKRLLFAQNIDKTIENVVLDDLVRYSGPKGAAKYAQDFVKSAAGTPSNEFLKHHQALEASAFLADQMRQFYGDSIQPQAMQRLRSLTNPSTWYKNPEVAKAQFKTLINILRSETETFKKAGTSPVKLRPVIDFEQDNFVLKKPEKKDSESRSIDLSKMSDEELQRIVEGGK